MEFQEIKILCLSDVTIDDSIIVSEKLITENAHYDFCILIGPIAPTSPAIKGKNKFEASSSTNLSNNQSEQEAVRIADTSYVIAQLENVVCRLAFLTGEEDHLDLKHFQMNLTPNSLNIHGRALPLIYDELFIFGANLGCPYQVGGKEEDEMDSDDETPPPSLIQSELIGNVMADQRLGDQGLAIYVSNSSCLSGLAEEERVILSLHSEPIQNHVHQDDSSSSNTKEKEEEDNPIPKHHFIPSFRHTGTILSVTLVDENFNISGRREKWKVTNVETRNIIMRN